VGAHDGEQAERRENQCHATHSTNPASEPNTWLVPRRATDRDIGEEHVERFVGPGSVHRFKSFFKLVPAEPPLSRRVP